MEVLGIDPDRPRAVLFYSRERNLGGYVLANQTEPNSERTIKLEKCGAIQGHLIGMDGKPLANVGLGLKPVALRDRSRDAVIPYSETDQAGNFKIQSVPPRVAFDLIVLFPPNEVVREAITLNPAERRDIGEIRLKQTQSQPRPNFSALQATSTTD